MPRGEVEIIGVLGPEVREGIDTRVTPDTLQTLSPGLGALKELGCRVVRELSFGPSVQRRDLSPERVAELTSGSVKVDALCCAQLGNDVAQAKTVQLRTKGLAIVSGNNPAQFDPCIDIFF